MEEDIYAIVKNKLDLAEIIGEDVPLRGRGHEYRGDRDDCNSLVVTRNRQTGEWYYYWNSKNEAGDVINWLKNQRGMDTKTALEYAAGRAKVSLPDWTRKDTKAWLKTKANEDVMTIATRVFHKWLLKNEDALSYAKSRGWSDETIKKAKLGFSGSGATAEKEEMVAEFKLHGIPRASAAAVAVLGFSGNVDKWAKDQGMQEAIGNDDILNGYLPGFMGRTRLIYPHLYFGHSIYLSSRNLQKEDDGFVGFDKPKSFNPRIDFLGERKPFYGHNYQATAGHIAIVEGQADVITLAQLGVNVVGMCGAKLDDSLAEELQKRHESRYFATDSDKAGQLAIRGKDGSFPVADLLGPLAQIVQWQGGNGDEIKDANDLLISWIKSGIEDADQKDQIWSLLNSAEPVAIMAAKEAAKAQKSQIKSVEDKIKMMARAFEIIAKIDKKTMTMMLREFISALDMRVAEFNRTMKAVRGESDDLTSAGDPIRIEEIFGGWFPLNEVGDKGWLIDYLWDPIKKKARFAYRDPNGEIGTASKLDIDGIRYFPRVDDNVRIGLVQFPSELGKEKTTRELVALNEAFMRRSFLLDNPLNYQIAAYYAQFTWLYDAFDELSYLKAEGDANSGKSAIMIRIGHLCYRMIRTSGVGTAASLKYMQHMYKGTIFMDEIPDNLDEFDERVTMLNIGAMKDQAWITNANPSKQPDGSMRPEVQAYNVFGPKLVTMYGKFPQKATESRFLTFKTFEKEPIELIKKDIPRRLNDEWHEHALQKRNMDITWRLKNWQPRIQPPDELEDLQVSTRVNQVTVPIKYLVKDDPAALRDVELVVRGLYQDQQQERMMGKEARVLDAILAVLGEKKFVDLNMVKQSELKLYGMTRYISYSDLTRVTNWIMDEMNTGIDAVLDMNAGDEADGSYGKKKGKKGMTSQTIGYICRQDFRLPIHRMGRGYVIILESSSQPEAAQERIEMLKLKFGITDFDGDGEKVESAESLSDDQTKDEEGQGELL